MARHPATEGNELHPSDVKFPNPAGGDGKLSLKNDVAAEFSALALSNTRPTNMPDGGLWVNLSAEATGLDRLQTYDASTDAFIPITADQTIVAENPPEPQRGLLWFEPVANGSNLYAASSTQWEFLQFITNIPDSVVDDFEDNNLNEYTNSGGWETTTNNVIEGSYALGFDGTDNLPFMYSLAGDGLDYYPTKGDKFSVFMRSEAVGGDNSAPVVGWGSPDGDSGYAISHFNFSTWGLERYDNGSPTQLQDSGQSFNGGQWYEYEIQWHDGSGSEPDNEIVVTQYTIDTSANLTTELGRDTERGTASANDNNYANGRGIFYHAESGNVGQITISDRFWYLGDVD